MGPRSVFFFLIPRSVFSTFFEPQPPETPTWMKDAKNYYELPEQEGVVSRVKRSVFAAIMGDACTAGWTGQFCENRLLFLFSKEPQQLSVWNAVR